MNFYVLCIYDIGTMDECLFCRKLHRVIKFKAQFLYWISKALKMVLPIKTKVFLTTLPSAEILMFNILSLAYKMKSKIGNLIFLGEIHYKIRQKLFKA